MKILNTFRFADKGKVLINLEDFTHSTILPLVIPYKECNQEEVDWEIMKLKYDLRDD